MPGVPITRMKRTSSTMFTVRLMAAAQRVTWLTSKDESKRLEGYKAFDREILENAYILPMFQYFQPVVFNKQLSFHPHTAGYVMPSLFQRQG